MKKIASIIIVFAICSFVFCGCGNNSKIHLTKPDGSEVDLTKEELDEKYDENPLTFPDEYYGSKAEFISEVKTIGTPYFEEYVAANRHFQVIDFENSVSLKIVAESHDDVLKQIKVGDKLKVTTKYNNGFSDIEEVTKSNRRPKDYTKIEMVE